VAGQGDQEAPGAQDLAAAGQLRPGFHLQYDFGGTTEIMEEIIGLGLGL
jgi:hypothetical protein